MIGKERKRKLKADTEGLRAKMRLTQIEELEMKVELQSAQLQSKIEKMNDVDRLNRILMMERAWKFKLDTEEMQRKRYLCKKRKMEEDEATLEKTNKKLGKLDKLIYHSLSNTMALREEVGVRRAEAEEQNRKRA
jgi:hypothetical protein